jgi:ADP-ribose pyrophosphatase YjhB (NUDIX family)
MKDYIKWIRSKVGHEPIILNFSGACITNKEGQILLQKRSKEVEAWGLPGGAVEIGESIEEAMLREVKEETGLDVIVEHLIGVYSKYFAAYQNGDEAQTICYLFKCTVADGELAIDNEETFELRFFNMNEIPELFNQQHKDMIKDFIQNRTGVFK